MLAYKEQYFEDISYFKESKYLHERLIPLSKDNEFVIERNPISYKLPIDAFLQPYTIVNLPLSHIIKAIEESKNLLNLQFDWDDDGALPLDYHTWENATSTLQKYSQFIYTNYRVKIDAPFINLCKDGSLDLEWRKENGYIFLMNILNKEELEIHYYGEDYRTNNSLKGILKDATPADDLLFWMKKLI